MGVEFDRSLSKFTKKTTPTLAHIYSKSKMESGRMPTVQPGLVGRDGSESADRLGHEDPVDPYIIVILSQL